MRPQRTHHFDALIAAPAAVLERHAAGGILLARPTDTDTDVETAFAQPVERCDVFGGVDGVTLWQQHHPGGESDAFRRRGDERVRHEWIRNRERRGEERFAALGSGIAVDRPVEEDDVLAQPHLDEAEVFGTTRDVAQHPRSYTRRRHRQIESELQRRTPRLAAAAVIARRAVARR